MEIESIKPDPSIGAVLFGFDINISYTKLAKAFTYLHSNPSCHFLATNDDSTFPTGGTVYPGIIYVKLDDERSDGVCIMFVFKNKTFLGTGALLSALSHPLGRKPKVLGKPHQTMLDVIIAQNHLDRNRTCMVGDRLNTDIEFGKLGGLKTLLVLTGELKGIQLLILKENLWTYSMVISFF